MPTDNVISKLLGRSDSGFSGSVWPADIARFTSDPEWFHELSAIGALRDPEEWLDRAPELMAFDTRALLARSDARRRYASGESIYITGLDRMVKPLRELCSGLAADLSLSPPHVTIEAWAAGGPTSVGMHYDHDFNFNVQVSGRKQWQTAANDLVANPIRSHRAASSGSYVAIDSGRALPTEMPADAKTWEAAPGDVVYLPRGVWHATRTAEATFAMAFVIKPPTWGHHVTSVLLDRLHAEPRWRERVLGGRDFARHVDLRATAGELLTTARGILDGIGPSDVLYSSLWGRKPDYLKRRDDVVECRFDEASARLTWQRGGEGVEFPIPAWAHDAAAFIATAPGSWSIAALHDLVGDEDVPFVRILVAQLSNANLLERAVTGVGGVAARAT